MEISLIVPEKDNKRTKRVIILIELKLQRRFDLDRARRFC